MHRRVAPLVSAALLCVAFAPGLRIDLPTGVPGRQSRLLQAAFDAQQFGPVENHAPGLVRIDEEVRLEVSSDGEVGALRTLQQLQIEGVGDYVLEVPTGATAISPRLESDNTPGLRQGTVLWEGFSKGTEHLAAELLLDDASADRFPVELLVTATANERHLRLSNATSISLAHDLASVAAEELRAAMATTSATLEGGGRVQPGQDGVPTGLTAQEAPISTTSTVVVPVHVVGTVWFDGVPSPVDVTLPSAAAPDGTFELSGPGPMVPELEVQLLDAAGSVLADLPALPEGQAADAVTARRSAVAALVNAIGQSLRAQDYLPFIPGFVDTEPSVSFRIVGAEPAAAQAEESQPQSEKTPDGRGLALVAGMLLVTAAGALWSQA